MNAQPRRRVPMVFRFAAALLLIAAAEGGWWQHQPGGGATRLLLHGLARSCPAAVRVTGPVTVATGAHALDRTAWAMLLDRLVPQPTSRCTGKSSKDNQAEGARG